MLTVKNVKTFGGMENPGWSCDLLLEGKKIGSATERGIGADVELDIKKPEDHKRLHEHCLDLYKAAGKNLDLLDTVKPFNGYASDFLVECAVGPLVSQFEQDKKIKGWCRTQIVFQTAEGHRLEPHKYRTIKKKYDPSVDRAEMQKRYGADVIILNDRFL